MTTNSRSRQPAGIPVGGQYAPETRNRSTVSIGEDEEMPADESSARPVFAKPGTPYGQIDRADRVAAMRAEIDEAMALLSNAEGWQAFLEQSAKLHHYSLNNRLLLAMQNPEASMVAGFQDWKKNHGRKVKAGEKAMWVLAPVLHKEKTVDDDGREDVVPRFVGSRPVGVFDISQTEPIPGDPRGTSLDNPAVTITSLEGQGPDGMTEDLTRAARQLGFEVVYEDTGSRAAGYTDFQNKRIVIRPGDSHRERANTLAHELGHVACGHADHLSEYHTGSGGRRPDMEVEAESVAYVLSRHYGIAEAGQANFGYIDSWARGDTERVKKTATTVVSATKSVLGIIETRQQAAA